MIPAEARRPPSLSTGACLGDRFFAGLLLRYGDRDRAALPVAARWRQHFRRDQREPDLQPATAHRCSYSVAVFNAAGSVLSSNAFLTVFIPAAILAQPQSKAVFPNTTNVTFSVTAASSTPIRYQWRFNGNAIPNATNTSYTLPIAQPGGDGDYTVVITDDVGPLISAPAHLTVLLHPVITAQPTNRSVIFGGAAIKATFTVTAVSDTPLRYRWLFNGVDLPRRLISPA